MQDRGLSICATLPCEVHFLTLYLAMFGHSLELCLLHSFFKKNISIAYCYPFVISNCIFKKLELVSVTKHEVKFYLLRMVRELKKVMIVLPV